MKKINFLKTSMAIAIILAIISCSKNKDNSVTRAVQPNTVTEEMISEKGTNPDEASITENTGNISADLNGSLAKASK